METYAKPDKTYICQYCESEYWQLDDGIAIYLDFGFDDIVTICVTCAQNLVS